MEGGRPAWLSGSPGGPANENRTLQDHAGRRWSCFPHTPSGRELTTGGKAGAPRESAFARHRPEGLYKLPQNP